MEGKLETVKFNTVEEFLKELEMEKDNVDRKIVRVTGLTAPSGMGPLYSLTVIATAVIFPPGGSHAPPGKHLVKLQKGIGQIYYFDGKISDSQSEEAWTRGKEVTEELEGKLKAMGFDVRPGVVELESEVP